MPAIFQMLRKAFCAHSPGALGMSYELADAHVDDMRAEVWSLTRVTFTGAAIFIARKSCL